MSLLERPKLRPLTARRIEQQGQSFVMLQDPTGVVPQPVLIPLDGYSQVVRHFNGQSTLIEIQARVLRETGQFVAMKDLQDLVRRFDETMIIEGPAFAMFHQQYRESGRRPPALAGRSYAATLRSLRAQLDQFFVGAQGAGEPAVDRVPQGAGFRGILSPHIDFQRGGPVYTWSYRELVEQSHADTFVILGVAHQYCRRRFALTSQGLRDSARRRRDRPVLCRSDRLPGRPRPLRRRAVPSDRALDRIPGGFPPAPPGRAPQFHDRSDPGRLIPRPDGAGGRPDRGLRRCADSSRPCAWPRRRAASRWPTSAGSTCATSVRNSATRARWTRVLQEQVRQFDGAMLDRAAAGDPQGWFRTAGRGGEPLAGLRPGGDLYFLARHRPGPGPAAPVQPGAGRPEDLLRQLREHGVPSIRALFDFPPCQFHHLYLTITRAQPSLPPGPRLSAGPARPPRISGPRSCVTTRRQKSAAGMARDTG